MKTFASLALATCIMCIPAVSQAAFEGPSATAGTRQMTVEKALSLSFDRDDVCMVGNIVNRIMADHEKYTFQDATGSMVVEIDDEVFAGQHVTPQTRVRICGDVDAETFKPNEFDVEGLQVLQ